MDRRFFYGVPIGEGQTQVVLARTCTWIWVWRKKSPQVTLRAFEGAVGPEAYLASMKALSFASCSLVRGSDLAFFGGMAISSSRLVAPSSERV
jgi:hypothetical protein